MELYTGLIEFNWTLVMQWVTVLVLYLILKRFFFEKVHNFMMDRQNAVKDAFDRAEHSNQMADDRLAEYNKKIAEIEEEGREIIKKAKIKADAQAKEIVDEANKKSNELLLHAQKEIEREKLKAVSEMRQQIAGLAVYAAEKIIERQLDASGQEEIIQRVIDQAGSSGWQN